MILAVVFCLSMNENVKKLISLATESSGVYLFSDKEKNIIYIGKAKNLKNRLKSYISYKTHVYNKYRRLYDSIDSLVIKKTKNEYEALLLEAKLIKKYIPKYNIMLKDGKYYPYLKINKALKWPYLQIVRKKLKDNADYFGPFTNSSDLDKLIKTINRIFSIRKCRYKSLDGIKTPCLNYQIHTCKAPCCGFIKHENYMKVVTSVISVLNGNIDEILGLMKKDMLLASDSGNFDEASRLRDRVNVFEKMFG